MLESFEDKILYFIVLLISITMHEFGHAYSAYKFGDLLPKAMGRVTLNPLAHADPIGTFVLPLLMIFTSGGTVLFGWGKPVIVSLPNPRTRKRDDIITSLSGPVMNLLLALIGMILVVVGAYFEIKETIEFGSLFIITNCMLFVFNMLPIPPLDGSHMLRYILKVSNETYAKIQQYGFWILLILIFLTPFGSILSRIIYRIFMLFINLADIIYNLLTSK